MGSMQEYLKDKLAEFNKVYNAEFRLYSYSNRDIKQQWKEDSKRIYNQWLSVKSISDVKRYVNGFIATVEQYENIKGYFSDAYDMDLVLYKGVNAIQKMAQCYDMEDFEFHKYRKEDIDKLFDILYDGLEKMKNVNMRRAMQD